MNLYLYGPPGSGKSTVGRYVAQHTGFGFVDLDILIETLAGKAIPDIFELEGEAGFRRLEKTALEKVTCCHNQVVALGGGALLDNENRQAVEDSGIVFCLQAETQTLARRLNNDETQRPLLAEDQQNKLEQLLNKRKEHYASFRNQIVTDQKSVANIAWEIQTQAGLFLVEGMGLPYEVRVEKNGLKRIGEILAQKGFRGQLFVLTDENVAQYYYPALEEQLTQKGFKVSNLVLPPGEQTKNMDTVQRIWTRMVEQGVDRSSTLIALGGGVVSDIGGFVSATYMRGIPWIVLPTTLLAMADASLGGKTGVDLPSGKNLIGAFHSPRFVLADPQTLQTLPEQELRAGMAEVVKSAVIGDGELMHLCRQDFNSLHEDLEQIVKRAMAVKIKIIQADPYEKGQRAVLNFGHTIGHAIENLSGYSIPHGLCVSMGMVAETRLAEELQLAQHGLSTQLRSILSDLGLPVKIPAHYSQEALIQAMQSDKKKKEGTIRFALPIRIGEVKAGIVIEDTHLIQTIIQECQA